MRGLAVAAIKAAPFVVVGYCVWWFCRRAKIPPLYPVTGTVVGLAVEYLRD